MKVVVQDIVSMDGTGPDDYGLSVGQVVEVVGFVISLGLQAVVVVTDEYGVIGGDHYAQVPAWYLRPLVEVPA